MARSREDVRQNKAMQQILRGETPDRRIFVAMEDVNEQKERKRLSDEERIESEKRTEALKAARMPWFCPKCDKVMKKRLDDKMYRLYNHCFDCQVKIEHKLKLEGKFDDWANEKMRNNKIAIIKDTLQQLEEFKTMKAPEWLNNVGVNYPELEKEKWEGGTEKMVAEAEEAIEKLTKQLEELEKEV